MIIQPTGKSNAAYQAHLTPNLSSVSFTPLSHFHEQPSSLESLEETSQGCGSWLLETVQNFFNQVVAFFSNLFCPAAQSRPLSPEELQESRSAACGILRREFESECNRWAELEDQRVPCMTLTAIQFAYTSDFSIANAPSVSNCSYEKTSDFVFEHTQELEGYKNFCGGWIEDNLRSVQSPAFTIMHLVISRDPGAKDMLEITGLTKTFFTEIGKESSSGFSVLSSSDTGFKEFLEFYPIVPNEKVDELTQKIESFFAKDKP